MGEASVLPPGLAAALDRHVAALALGDAAGGAAAARSLVRGIRP
jgi:hypothetical protein